MKLVYPDINCVFDTEISRVNCIVIENPNLLYSILNDINLQLNGYDGKVVISQDNKPLKIDKQLELIWQFIPFELNQKTLINKIISQLEKKAVSDSFYSATLEILSELEQYLMNLSFDFPCDIRYNKIDIGSLLKASGVELNDSYTSLGEKIIDYMELVTEFDRRKLFVTVNLRSFISDSEASEFMKTALGHGYDVIMIESSEHKRLDEESRYIIDADLCEIK